MRGFHWIKFILIKNLYKKSVTTVLKICTVHVFKLSHSFLLHGCTASHFSCVLIWTFSERYDTNMNKNIATCFKLDVHMIIHLHHLRHDRFVIDTLNIRHFHLHGGGVGGETEPNVFSPFTAWLPDIQSSRMSVVKNAISCYCQDCVTQTQNSCCVDWLISYMTDLVSHS